MESFWADLRKDVRRELRWLLWFWGIGTVVVLAGFLIYLGRLPLEAAVLAIAAPPVVWLVRKALY